MNNKILLGVFVVLCAIYFLTKTFRGNTQRSFKTELIQIDTSSVTSFEVKSKTDEYEPILVERGNGNWIMKRAGKEYAVASSSVNGFLSNLVLVKTLRVVTRDLAKYDEYEVGESTAKARIKVMQGSNIINDFVVGGFRFNQQSRSATSFLKLAEGDEVYAVDGFVSMSMASGFDSYRDKTFIKTEDGAIAGFSVQGQGFNYGINKATGTWTASAGLIDSTKVESYLNTLRSMSGSEILDDFNPATGQKLVDMTIDQNNASPINIECYSNPAGKPFAFRSSLNNQVFFASDSTGIYSRLFKPISYFQD